MSPRLQIVTRAAAIVFCTMAACGAPGAKRGASGDAAQGGADAGPLGTEGDATAPLVGGDAMTTDAGIACGLLYLIGQDRGATPDPGQPVVLYSFDPAKAALSRIGPIPCISAAEEFPLSGVSCAPPATGGCSTAMTIDDNGIAWIFTPWEQGSLAGQKVFAVRTSDASCVGPPLHVSAEGFGVVGAAVLHPNWQLGDPGQQAFTVALEDVDNPTGIATFGDFDTVSGAIDDVRAADLNARGAQNGGWFWGGNAATLDPHWMLLWEWPTPCCGPMLLSFDTECHGAGSGCANAMLDGGPAPEGTPVGAMGIFMPPSLTHVSRPWTAVWAPYVVLSTTPGSYFEDFYYFTPGWWASGNREVLQADVTEITEAGYPAVHRVLPDLGANAFAAAAGPQCAPVASLPPPPPTQ